MKTAIHFGAGNIGRGFIGSLLSQAGYRVVFADVNRELVEAIAAAGQYTLRIVGDTVHTETITNVTALANDDERLLAVSTEADLITTAVGPNILVRLAPVVSQFIRRRREDGIERPLNIIACENMVGGSSRLGQEVMKYLGREEREWCRMHIGFPDAVVDRIVPPATDMSDKLAVSVESFHEWTADRKGFVGEFPVLDGLNLTGNLPAYVERKLFTLNTGHSVAAYLGRRAGYTTIRQSVSNPEIRACVRCAMVESGAVLVQRHGFHPAEHAKYVEKILARFDNPWLDDSVDRVGRDPLRKLSANDRFILPMTMAASMGLSYEHLMAGAAAAFCFEPADDPAAADLQRMLRQYGVRETVKRVTGLEEGNPILEDMVARVELLDPVRFESKEGA